MVQESGPGNNPDFLEAALIVVCHCAVQGARLAAAAPSSSDDPERHRGQMFKTTLSVYHFAPLGWAYDGLIFARHLVFNVNAKITLNQHNGGTIR